jgi:four helix bundle protein
VVSIPSNVAEGHQHGTKIYLHFVSLALGGLAEANTQIEIARRLEWLDDADAALTDDLTVSLRRLLHGLRRSLLRRRREESRRTRSLRPDP